MSKLENLVKDLHQMALSGKDSHDLEVFKINKTYAQIMKIIRSSDERPPSEVNKT